MNALTSPRSILTPILILLISCNPEKPSEPKTEENTKLKEVRLFAEEIIKSHLVILEDGSHATHFQGRYNFSDANQIIHIKGLKISTVSSFELKEADKLNGITWKGCADLQYKAMRTLDLDATTSAWSKWESPIPDIDDMISESGTIYIEEKNNKLIVSSAHIGNTLAGGECSFENCHKNPKIATEIDF